MQLLKQQNTFKKKRETLLHEHQAVYGSGSLSGLGHTLQQCVRKVTICSVLQASKAHVHKF